MGGDVPPKAIEPRGDLAPAQALERAWYTASSHEEQAGILDELVRRGLGQHGGRSDLGAVSALIELCHLTRFPRARLPILRAMGQCIGHAFVVPPLVAELNDRHDIVVVAALDALASVGMPFGGRSVLRWYDRQRPEDLSPQAVTSAMRVFARTGLPEAPERIESAWRAGRLPTRAAHLTLAEAVSTRLRDEACLHLNHAELADAAVLHLAAIRDPELPALLSALLDGPDPTLALLASRILQENEQDAASLLNDLSTRNHHPLHRRRLSRTLRVMPPDERLVAFRDRVETSRQIDLIPVGATRVDPFQRTVFAALQSGVPELLDAALDAVAHSPKRLRAALRELPNATPSLRARCATWLHHEEDRVAADAMRALVSTRGRAALDELRHLRDSDRVLHRVEWVRALQNVYRNDRDAHGRSTLDATTLAYLEGEIGGFLRDPERAVQKLALYTAGNVGLTGLATPLLDVLATETDDELRQAAATSIGELEPARHRLRIAAALAMERVDKVLFRLIRALLRAGNMPPEERDQVAAVIRERRPELADDARVLSLILLGLCGDATDLPVLLAAVRSPALAESAAAVTALGRLGLPDALDPLVQATQAEDPERRRRAAVALTGFPESTDTLLGLLTDPDESLDVRLAAAEALADHPLLAQHASLLTPRDLEDPLAVTLLSLQQRCVGRLANPALIDQRLQQAVDGLDLEQLTLVQPDVGKALRTAEFFHLPGVDLPADFDAAPPVLFWAKALEVWLKHRLGAALDHLIGPANEAQLDEILRTWKARRRRVAARWKNDLLPWHTHDLSSGLGGALNRIREMRARRFTGGRSLEVFAAALIATLEGEEPWALGLTEDERIALANRLAALNHERNKLAHGRVGLGRRNGPVRALALQAVGCMVRLDVDPASLRHVE